MNMYEVHMNARPDGGGTDMSTHVNAYSEYHAMALAAQLNPNWYPVAARKV